MEMAIDEDLWRSKGLGVLRDGDTRYRFIIPGRSDVCDAIINGNAIQLHPGRDVAQRALLALLQE